MQLKDVKDFILHFNDAASEHGTEERHDQDGTQYAKQSESLVTPISMQLYTLPHALPCLAFGVSSNT
jgi:hypothetical protein